MSYFKHQEDAVLRNGNSDHGTWPMLDQSNGCPEGVYASISFYQSEEFRPLEVHDDMEAFVVLSGSGWAKVGDECFPLRQNTCFVAPAGVPHCVKCDDAKNPLMMFWFHAPME